MNNFYGGSLWSMKERKCSSSLWKYFVVFQFIALFLWAVIIFFSKIYMTKINTNWKILYTDYVIHQNWSVKIKLDAWIYGASNLMMLIKRLKKTIWKKNVSHLLYRSPADVVFNTLNQINTAYHSSLFSFPNIIETL